ncbi:MAG: CocE/NonD family hydrolase [Longimicrobiales bacterium]
MRLATMHRCGAVLALTLVAAGCARDGSAQAGEFDVRAHYTKSEHMVAMRDGVELFTVVYQPKDSSVEYPILLFRTPYSIPPYGIDEYATLLGPSVEFDRDGYIFVFQDARGKFRSEGEFEVMRPYIPVKSGPTSVDESSDTYDTIEWALETLPQHNGRVGMWGISYPGWQTVMGMMDAHPALVAVSPQASPADMFIGDDFHHNGAFRLMYAFSWLAGNARPRSGQTTERGERFDYGTPDGYNFFMDAGTPGSIDSLYFHGEVPAWNDFMSHPDYDEYWHAQNVLKDLDDIRPAVLNVAGWFDAEDFYGPMSIYYTIEANHPQPNRSTLVVGPWRHGGWRSSAGDSLGHIAFGQPTSEYFKREVQFPFFQHHLKGEGDWSAPEAVTFETGSNEWRTYDTWPPSEAVERNLYFHANGGLSFEAPTAASAYDEYVSDPNRPVPFSAEPRTTQGHLWMIEDQRFAARRPDVLVYQTPPLEEDVTIAGPIIASIDFTTTGTDADFIVKLIDVLPGDAPDPEPNPAGVRMGDFQMLLAAEVFRAKYRNSYSEPEPLVPGQVTHLEFDLRDRHHTFRAGHRIMVQVQSTWFPVIDRNPQRFVNIYEAQPEDYQKATHRVLRSTSHPSHLQLKVIPEAGAQAQAN